MSHTLPLWQTARYLPYFICFYSPKDLREGDKPTTGLPQLCTDEDSQRGVSYVFCDEEYRECSALDHSGMIGQLTHLMFSVTVAGVAIFPTPD